MYFLKNSICTIITISIVVVGSVFHLLFEDKLYSEIENKILQQAPNMNIESVKDGRYMREVESYLIEQFPLRTELIKMKNNILYKLGQSEFNEVYVTKSNRFLEKFIFNKDTFKSNLDMMNLIEHEFGIETVGMFIPTSITIYENELPSYAITDNEYDVLNYIKENFKGDFYSPYKILLENKEDDIFFKTDHHWTQYGAKLMYEDYYGRSIDYKYEKVSGGFLGTYYSKTLVDLADSDNIYSYSELSDYYMEYDGQYSDSLYNVLRLDGKNKYQYFLNGDPAMGVVYGEGDGEVLIFKDSFSHAYIPFLVKEYSKIHIVDPRYSNYNIKEYI